jgi:hypothetical protein
VVARAHRARAPQRAQRVAALLLGGFPLQLQRALVRAQRACAPRRTATASVKRFLLCKLTNVHALTLTRLRQPCSGCSKVGAWIACSTLEAPQSLHEGLGQQLRPRMQPWKQGVRGRCMRGVRERGPTRGVAGGQQLAEHLPDGAGGAAGLRGLLEMRDGACAAAPLRYCRWPELPERRQRVRPARHLRGSFQTLVSFLG